MAARAALVVAAHEFADDRFQRLRSPSRDVDALAEVLGDPAVGGFDVRAVVNQPNSVVQQELERFFSGRRPDDLLLLYFSCHGVKDPSGRLYFVTTNTVFDLLRSTGISATFVSEQMEYSRSKRIVVLLDCCYSGAFLKGFRARGDDVVAVEQLEGRGRAVITASRATEYAFEAEHLASERAQPSMFTGAVVEGLRTGRADADGDGLVTVDELYDYVYDAVRGKVAGQTPGRWVDVEGDLVVARNPSPPVRAAVLPLELQRAVESDAALQRLGAVAELARWHLGDDPGRRLAAAAVLEQLSRDYDERVRTAAATALAATEPVPLWLAPRPPPPPAPPTVPAPAPTASAPGMAGAEAPTAATPAASPGLESAAAATPVAIPGAEAPTAATPVAIPAAEAPTAATPVAIPAAEAPTAATPAVTPAAAAATPAAIPGAETPTAATPAAGTPTLEAPTVPSPSAEAPTVPSRSAATPTAATPTAANQTAANQTAATPTAATPTAANQTVAEPAPAARAATTPPASTAPRAGPPPRPGAEPPPPPPAPPFAPPAPAPARTRHPLASRVAGWLAAAGALAVFLSPYPTRFRYADYSDTAGDQDFVTLATFVILALAAFAAVSLLRATSVPTEDRGLAVLVAMLPMSVNHVLVTVGDLVHSTSDPTPGAGWFLFLAGSVALAVAGAVAALRWRRHVSLVPLPTPKREPGAAALVAAALLVGALVSLGWALVYSIDDHALLGVADPVETLVLRLLVAGPLVVGGWRWARARGWSRPALTAAAIALLAVPALLFLSHDEIWGHGADLYATAYAVVAVGSALVPLLATLLVPAGLRWVLLGTWVVAAAAWVPTLLAADFEAGLLAVALVAAGALTAALAALARAPRPAPG